MSVIILCLNCVQNLFLALRLYGGKSRKVDNVLHRAPAGKVVHRFSKALVNGADGVRAAQSLHQFIGDIRRLEIGEN